MINWTIGNDEMKLINDIAQRALACGYYDSPLLAIMDITAVHANGNPLRLRELAQADAFNFSHDVIGIIRHLDRDTGKLTDHFRPRYSR